MLRSLKPVLVAVGVLMLMSAAPILGGAALLAFLSVGATRLFKAFGNAGQGFRSGLKGQAVASGDDGSLSLSRTVSQGKYFDRRKGWNVSAMPLDMIMDAGRSNGNVAVFSCAGVDGLVTATAGRDGGAKFSFALDDLAAAKRCQDLKSRGNSVLKGMEVVQSASGGYTVSCGNAEGISLLASVAYPSRTLPVEREVKTVRQYVVSGVSSYDEAVKKLDGMKDSVKPDNVFDVVTYDVNGSKSVMGLDRRLDFPLEVGTYIVDAVSVSASKGKVSVPGNVSGEKDTVDYIAENFKGGQSVVKDKGLSYEDGTSESVKRYMYLGEGSERVFLDRSMGEGQKPSFVFRFDTYEEMGKFLSGENVPAKTYALLENSPEFREGEFVVTVPAESLDNFVPSLSDVDGYREKYGRLGMSGEAVMSGLALDALARNGHVTGQIREGLSLDDARINGVSIDEFSERMTEGERFTRFTEPKQVNDWLQDAVKIQAVSVTLDLKNAVLRVESVIDNNHRIEERKLTADEVRSLAKRGDISKTEAKDLLMQIHPSIFKSYAASDGGSLFVDPVSAFIKGQVPEVRKVQEVPKIVEQRKLVNNNAPKLKIN